jgi:hypothetical protein
VTARLVRWSRTSLDVNCPEEPFSIFRRLSWENFFDMAKGIKVCVCQIWET